MFQFTYSYSSSSSSSSSSYFIIIIFIIIYLGSNFFQFSTTTSLDGLYNCLRYINASSSCQNGIFLDYPFWYRNNQLEQQYAYCGYPGLGITCSPSGRPIINISNHSYYVIKDVRLQSIINILNILDTDLAEKECPRPRHNFTFDQNSSHSVIESSISDNYYNFTFFFNCTSAPPSLSRSYHLECLDYNDLHSYGSSNADFYVESLADWNRNSCQESVVVPTRYQNFEKDGYIQDLQSGFVVDWSTPIECISCESSGGFCSYNETASSFNCWCEHERQLRHRADGTEYCFDYDALRKKILIGALTGVGGLMFITFVFVYLKNQRKRRKSIARNVEQFIESYGCRSLQRYKYRDIKKMTNSFKDKLGQGGYGNVFKGKLVDGRLVAVKVLINDPKKNTNGEDFMNEVATIGRTNHVNIVALLGFCSSGSKRALVYEFMANGSLEKFIYAVKHEKSTTTECSTTGTSITSASSNEGDPLGWEKLYQIALGIARGLEYLHRGCNTGRILHFDIKPHNILLDENFCPKISNFGLAKLCPTRESIVSMLSCGRGTIGYIAPEIYNRNFGGVSYKSDVYSYGMMVLEMVGGRKNIDPFVNNTSEIYFPHWIYNRLEKHNDKIEVLLRFEEAFDEEIAKKMIMVGLWCIQTSQADRPSMGRVAEMLEGSIKDLQMPPNPCVDSSLPPPSTA